MLDHHYNLIEKSVNYSWPGREGFRYSFKCGKYDCTVLWDLKKNIRLFRIDFWYVYGLQTEEQVWKVIDAYIQYMSQPGYPIADNFVETNFCKNSKFYKETFGDIKVKILDHPEDDLG